MICGGAVREKVMGTLTKLDDIDITNGEPSIKNLAQEVQLELGKKFSVKSKMMNDGHTSLFLGPLKVDFSSNFILPNIDQELAKIGIKNPTHIMREAYSRDFTCNSLLMDLQLKKILDPTKNGISDIKNKIIRTCVSPELTLKYNLNRIIRVVYLAAKLDFQIDPEITKFIKENKDLIKYIDPGYVTTTINKAIKYNADKTAAVLDELGIWDSIAVPEALHSHYVNRSKTAQRNFDYGEGFYSNMPDYKSVSDHQRKNKKKRKKKIKKIKDMKLSSYILPNKIAYYNGIDDYMTDNFPIILNDDLEVNMDRRENEPATKVIEDKAKGEEEKDGDETGETLINPSDFSGSMYSSMHGDEGLFAFPLSEYPGHLGEDQGAVVNNDYNPIYQSNGLLESRNAEDLADLFLKLAIK